MNNSRSIISGSVILIIFLLLGLQSYGQTDEYLMKAGFIEKFTRFINWPEDSVQNDATKPFIITVLGENPFDSKLDEFYSNTMIKDRKVRINYISTIEELNSCHILFVSDSFKNKVEDILNATRNHPILTIGETKGFAKKGVLINFYIEQNKIRFEMNKNSFKDSGLKVSHLLLKIAKIV